MFLQVFMFILQSLELGLVLLLAVLLYPYLQAIQQPSTRESNEPSTRPARVPWVEENPTNNHQPDTKDKIGDFDRVLDFVVRYIADHLMDRSTNQPFPDLDIKCPLSFGVLTVECHLLAKNGTLHGLASLRRCGHATTCGDAAGGLELEAAVGVQTLYLYYPEYSLRAGWMGTSGTLQAWASPVTLHARVGLLPPFTAELRSLSVARMGRLQLEASGLIGPLLPYAHNWLNERVAEYVQPFVMGHLTHLVEDTLQRFSRKVETLPPLRLFPDSSKVEYPCTSTKKDVVKNVNQKKERKEEVNNNTPMDESQYNNHRIQNHQWQDPRKLNDPIVILSSLPRYFGRPIEHGSKAPFRVMC